MPAASRPPHVARSLRWLAVAVLIALVAPVPGLAQDAGGETRSVQALRIPADAEVRLDGRVIEPFWDRADVATDFRQQEPDVGAPATETRLVRVAYDGENLYIGAVLRDSEPDGVLAPPYEMDQTRSW